MAKRNATPVVATPVVDATLILLAWEGIKAICFGLLTGSPWVEWTPIGKDKKPLPKVAVEGVVDGNRVCKYCKVGKQVDKLAFCKVINLILQNPSHYIVGAIGQPVKSGTDITWFQLIVKKLADRGIKVVHYRPTFEWSAKNDKGETIFGLGADWPLYQQRWESCKADEFAVSELYGKESWGQPVFSPINVLEVAKKAIENKMGIIPPIERGRGKHAKILQTVVPDGLLEAELEAMMNASK